MKRIATAVLFGCAACQLVADISDHPRLADSGVIEDAGVDIDAPTLVFCDPSASFDAPFKVTELDTPGYEHGLRLRPDERTAYFSRAPSGGSTLLGDLYKATRSDPFVLFDPPSLLRPEFNEGSHVGNLNPTVSEDESELFFDSYREVDAGGNDTRAIWRVPMKPALGAPSKVPIPFTEEVLEPYVVRDALYFVSIRKLPGFLRGTYNVFRIARTGGKWDVPAPVTEIDTDAQSERFPAVTPDERLLFFSRSVASGDYKMYTAWRTSTNEPFSNERALEELYVDAGVTHHPTWISPDGCTLYFTRDWDVWVAHRQPPSDR